MNNGRMWLFITGASSGIGEALVRHGASGNVVGGCRRAPLCQGNRAWHLVCCHPWQMGVVAKLLRLLPNGLFDALFARAGRKSRGLDAS